jgi:threonine dehydratase
LIGLQIADQQRNAFEHCLETLGLAYREETGNPAYRLFAGGSKTKSPD